MKPGLFVFRKLSQRDIERLAGKQTTAGEYYLSL
jgi:hypothetical protein